MGATKKLTAKKNHGWLMKIKVETKIFIGNMGVGWKDQKLVAVAYADFIRECWLRDLAGLFEQGHKITIHIDVEPDYTGIYTPVNVSCKDLELARTVHNTLSHEDESWKNFVNTDEADKLNKYLI